MKIVKKILIGIGIFIGLILITALFINKEYAVEREVVVNRPKAEVFEYVKYLKNQDDYSVWANLDPEMKKEYRGTDGTVGFVSAWDSQKGEVGKGEQEITAIEEDRVDYELRFIEPFEAKDHAYISMEPVDESKTRVKWGFDGKMSYPMNIMLLFMDMEKMLGEQLQTGLNNLKAKLEK